MAGAVIRARDEAVKDNGGSSNFSYIFEREISSCWVVGSGWCAYRDFLAVEKFKELKPESLCNLSYFLHILLKCQPPFS
jgi:hypothetical protein